MTTRTRKPPTCELETTATAALAKILADIRELNIRELDDAWRALQENDPADARTEAAMIARFDQIHQQIRRYTSIYRSRLGL